MNEEKLKQLFDLVKSDYGFKDADYDKFKTRLSDEAARKQFHDMLNTDFDGGFGDFEQFDGTLGLKKKEQPTQASQASGEAVGAGSVASSPNAFTALVDPNHPNNRVPVSRPDADDLDPSKAQHVMGKMTPMGGEKPVSGYWEGLFETAKDAVLSMPGLSKAWVHMNMGRVKSPGEWAEKILSPLAYMHKVQSKMWTGEDLVTAQEKKLYKLIDDVLLTDKAKEQLTKEKAEQAALLSDVLQEINALQEDNQNIVTDVGDAFQSWDKFKSWAGGVSGQGGVQILAGALTRGTSMFVESQARAHLEQIQEISKRTGLSPQEVVEQDLANEDSSMLTGSVVGALERIGLTTITSQFKKQVANSVVQRVGLFLTGVAGEAGTEGAQSVVQQVATGLQAGDNAVEAVKGVDGRKVLNEAAAGGLIGTKAGIGGAAYRGTVDALAGKEAQAVQQEINEQPTAETVGVVAEEAAPTVEGEAPGLIENHRKEEVVESLPATETTESSAEPAPTEGKKKKAKKKKAEPTPVAEDAQVSDEVVSKSEKTEPGVYQVKEAGANAKESTVEVYEKDGKLVVDDEVSKVKALPIREDVPLKQALEEAFDGLTLSKEPVRVGEVSTKQQEVTKSEPEVTKPVTKPVTKTDKETTNEAPKKDKNGYTVGDSIRFDAIDGTMPNGKIVGVTEDGKYKVEVKGAKGRTFNYTTDAKSIHEQAPAFTDKQYASMAAKKSQRGRVQPAGIQGRKPKKLREITLDLSKGLGNKIFYSKRPSGSRRSLGSYNPQNAGVAIRFANDLDVTAHELGHALDDKFGVFSNIPTANQTSINTELDKLSKYGSKPPTGHPNPQLYKRGEGVAEFFRAYIVNPTDAQRVAPDFYAWVKQAVPAEFMQKVEAFSEDVRAFVGAPAHEQIMANVEMEPQKLKGSLAASLRPDMPGQGFRLNAWDWLGTKFTNPFRAGEKAFKYAAATKGATNIRPEKDFRILSRNLLGVLDKFNNILNEGLVDSRNNRVVDAVTGENMGLKWLVEPFQDLSESQIKSEIEETISYMVAERTKELSNRFSREDLLTGIGGGIFKDTDLAAKRVQDVEDLRNTDPEKYDRITEAARRYREYADRSLKYMVEKGRLAQEQYNKIKQDNIQYVALQRINDAAVDEEIEIYSTSNKGGIGSSKEVLKKIKGSSKSIVDPYSTMLDFSFKSMREADRNEAMLAFREMFTVARSMYQGDAANLAEIARPAAQGDPNTVKIFVNGKAEFWQMQPDVYKSIKNITDTDVKLPFALTFPAKALRWTVTNFPVFAARNRVRDFMNRLIVSENSPEVGLGIYFQNKATKKDLRNSFDLFGGGQAGHHLLNQEFYYEQMGRAIKDLSTDKKTILIDPKKWAEKYNDFISLSETSGRMEEFYSAKKKAMKEGMDEYNANLYAAYQARDLMDFAVAGEYMRVINQLIPFSNAAVQGLRRTVRSAYKNPAEFGMRMMIYSMLPSLMNRMLIGMMGDEKEKEYQALPAYQRDLFFNFPMGENLWISIPKSFETGVIGSGADRFVDRFFYDNEKALDGYGGSIARSLFPVDEAAIAGPMRVPVELLTNFDFFKNKHIIPTHEEGKDLELRKTDKASRLGLGIQKVFGMDARMVDHAVKGQFSYFGGMAVKVSDLGREETNNSFNLGDLGFFKRTPAYNSTDVQWAMENSKKYGLAQDKLYKNMNELIYDYFNAPDDKEAERRAKVLRDYASALRKTWEANGLTDTEGDMKKERKKARRDIEFDKKSVRDAKKRNKDNK
jgi:hypothetical protein